MDTVKSDIPRARELISVVLDGDVVGLDRDMLKLALSLMKRAPSLRRARTQHKGSVITPEQKLCIKRLAGDRNLTCAQIATAAGLPSCAGGRVSEVLHGLR